MRYKIKCLICTPNVEMDFDHRSKHNLRFHQDMVKRCKHIRYEVVGAPRNPLEAAARRTVAQSTCVVTNACVTQDEGKEKELAERASNDHENDHCLSAERRLQLESQSNENLMPTAMAGKRPRLECQYNEESQETHLTYRIAFKRKSRN